MRLATLVFAVATYSLAQAPKLPQPVSPSDPETKQTGSEKSDKNVKPLAVQEPIQADPKQQRTQGSDSDTENNRRIADYTAKLAEYTEALVAVGIIQALIFIGHFVIFSKTLKAAREATAEQSRLTRKSNAITRRAVREAERSNAANEALTLDSNTNAKMSADAAKRSADMLLATERAWVLMELAGSNNLPLRINFRFNNYGRTPAWITEFRLQFTKSPTKALGPINYSVLPGMQCRDEVLAPGHPTGTYGEGLDGTGLLLDTEERDIINGSLYLHFFGMIKYRDISMVERQTNFCFTYLPKDSISDGYFFSTGAPEANKCI